MLLFNIFPSDLNELPLYLKSNSLLTHEDVRRVVIISIQNNIKLTRSLYLISNIKEVGNSVHHIKNHFRYIIKRINFKCFFLEIFICYINIYSHTLNQFLLKIKLFLLPREDDHFVIKIRVEVTTKWFGVW